MMPKRTVADNQMPQSGQRGLVATSDFHDMDYGPYNRFPPQRQKLTEFWLMRYDATIRAALFVIRFMIMNRIGEYAHEDEKVQEIVRGLLDRVDGGVKSVIRDMLSATWAGVSVIEMDWQTTGSEWWVERCDLLHPLSLFEPNGDKQGIVLDREARRVLEITQWATVGASMVTESVTLPIEKCMYWPLMADVREQVYGNSLLEGARRAWFSKVKQENFWNTFSQKSAMPTPVFWLPPKQVLMPDGRQVPLATMVTEFYQALEPGMALGIPVDNDMPHEMGLISPTGDGAAFEKLCKYWDSQLFKAVLTPKILMEEPEHASRAQSSTVMDLFILLLDGIRAEMGDVLVQQLIRPLVKYNIGDIGDWGTWEFDELQNKDLELLSRILETVERAKQTATMSGRPVNTADETKWRETFAPVYASVEEAEKAADEAFDEEQETAPEEIPVGDDEEPVETPWGQTQ